MLLIIKKIIAKITGIEDGLDEEIAFKDAQYEGDWDWKKDADGIIFYDRRYKKLKLV